MLSITHQFLFVHIPKTGGNSIQDRLRPFSEDRLVCLSPHQDGLERFELRSERFRTEKHSALAHYAREYGAGLFNSLRRFTCARNPWERVVSYYFSPHRGVVAWQPEDFRRFIPTVLPMRHYLALPGDDPADLAVAVGHVDRVLRFERLQEDFDALCGLLGITAQPLPQRNRSDHAAYRDYYDATTRALVASLFGDEAAHFGYSF